MAGICTCSLPQLQPDFITEKFILASYWSRGLSTSLLIASVTVFVDPSAVEIGRPDARLALLPVISAVSLITSNYKVTKCCALGERSYNRFPLGPQRETTISDDACTINMFWRGGKLPPLAQACIQSFISHGHPVRVHAYDILTLPAGAVLEDAREIIAAEDPLHQILADRVASFSDCFRYALLHQRGGWWVDTDVVCLTSHLPHEGRAWAEQDRQYLANAILRFPKDDPLCERLATLARRRAAQFISYNSLGPDLLTEVLSSYEGPRFGSRETFYPLDWREAYYLYLPELRSEVVRRTKGALFLHCWANRLRKLGIHPERSAPTESFLADILRQAPEALPPTSWQRFGTQQRIGRFMRVNNHRSARVAGWDGLAQKLGYYVPTPRDALAALRTIMRKHIASRPRLKRFVIRLRMQLYVVMRGVRLPP